MDYTFIKVKFIVYITFLLSILKAGSVRKSFYNVVLKCLTISNLTKGHETGYSDSVIVIFLIYLWLSISKLLTVYTIITLV